MTDDSPTTEPSGVPVYGAFIATELSAQDVRKASFEQRGLAVVTTSGVLVTLLLGLAAIATRNATTFSLPVAARYLMVGALITFVAAAVGALATNFPLRYSAVTSDQLYARLKEQPVRSETKAQLDIAHSGVKSLRRAKKMNGIKSWLLFAAITLEVAALAQLGIAVTVIFGR